MVKKVSEHEWYTQYEDDVFNQNKSIVIIFSADWCASCHRLLDSLEGHEFSVEVLNIDVDECDTLADEMSVTSLPVIVTYENGEVSNQFSNNYSIAELIDYISQMR